MTDAELKEKKLEELRELLQKADKQDPAKDLLDHGVEVLHHAEWLKDTTYKGSSKEVFICSRCNHWQSVRKLQKDQKMYMRYCPFCGAKMDITYTMNIDSKS